MRVLKWIGIGVAALAAALVVLIVVWDWNWFRDYANRAGSEASGRSFSIEGDIDVDLGWTSRVRVEGIRLANAEWAEAPDMVEIPAVEFDIELPELIRGRIVLPQLHLEQPVIRLQRRDDGTANWEFNKASTGGAAVEATTPDDRTEFPVIGRLRIEEGVLSYDAPADAVSIETKISTATGEAGDGSDRVQLEGNGSFAKEPFKLRLEAGSILSLRENTEPYPINIEANIGKTSVEAEGTAADPITLEGLDFRFAVKGADMADLFPIFQIPLPQTPPYALEGHLTKEETVWRFTGFKGRMGDSDLSGDLAYEPREERPFIKANLVSSRLDFDDLAGLIGAEPESKNKEPAPTKTRGEGRVLPDTTIDLTRLRAADMDIRFQGKRIRYPALPINSMDMRALLEDGQLKLDPLKFGIAGGTAAGTLTLDGRKDVPRVATNLNLRRLDLGEFFDGEAAGVTAGTFGGKIVLAGSGQSVARLLAVADGEVAMTMSGGRLSHLIVELAGIDVAEALPFLLDTDAPVELRCIVADFAVAKGRMESRALVIDTTDTLIEGEAVVDLDTEALDVRMLAHPKDPSPLSGRTPVTVGGTFAAPAVGIDPSGLAARGAAAVALGALLTPLAAIIPFIELGLGEDSDCNGLIAQAGGKGKN